eukprot:1161582-Pelagomonas_calceolata.AAC.4
MPEHNFVCEHVFACVCVRAYVRNLHEVTGRFSPLLAEHVQLKLNQPASAKASTAHAHCQTSGRAIMQAHATAITRYTGMQYWHTELANPMATLDQNRGAHVHGHACALATCASA